MTQQFYQTPAAQQPSTTGYPPGQMGYQQQPDQQGSPYQQQGGSAPQQFQQGSQAPASQFQPQSQIQPRSGSQGHAQPQSQSQPQGQAQPQSQVQPQSQSQPQSQVQAQPGTQGPQSQPFGAQGSQSQVTQTTPGTGFQGQQSLHGQQYEGSVGAEARQWSHRFSESVPNEVVTLANDLDRLVTVAEWAKSRATERGMSRLARVCDDIQDIATLEKKLVIRQSPFAQPLGQATQQVIQDGISELQQHLSQPEVQEALSEAEQSVKSISNALTRLQTAGMGSQQYGAQQHETQHAIGIQ